MRRITERGYPVAEVSQRLGISQHSLYERKKKFAASNAKGNDEAREIRRLKKELARVTEERDILKMRARNSPGMQSEAPVHCPASLAVFRADDLPPFAGSSRWFLRLADEPGEQASQRGQATDRSAPQGMGRERIRRRVHRSRDEAREDAFDYIEMFHNPKRKHARNAMLSPVEFEKQQKA